MNCLQCQNSLQPGAAFCDNCGTSAPPASALSASAQGGATCPQCNRSTIPGEAFCDNCGSVLPAPDASGHSSHQHQHQHQHRPAPIQTRQATTQPRLIVASSGAQIKLSSRGEFIIGREDAVSGIFPKIDLTNHGGVRGGVSRQHAKISKRGQQWMIEDLDSTNRTFVNKNRLAPHQPQPINHGDEIRIGRVALTFQSA